MCECKEPWSCVACIAGKECPLYSLQGKHCLKSFSCADGQQTYCKLSEALLTPRKGLDRKYVCKGLLDIYIQHRKDLMYIKRLTEFQSKTTLLAL